MQNFNGKSNVIKAKEGYSFQITTSENEMDALKGITDNKFNLTIIDLGACEKILRDIYHINESIPLIILKSERDFRKTTSI